MLGFVADLPPDCITRMFFLFQLGLVFLINIISGSCSDAQLLYHHCGMVMPFPAANYDPVETSSHFQALVHLH